MSSSPGLHRPELVSFAEAGLLPSVDVSWDAPHLRRALELVFESLPQDELLMHKLEQMSVDFHLKQDERVRSLGKTAPVPARVGAYIRQRRRKVLVQFDKFEDELARREDTRDWIDEAWVFPREAPRKRFPPGVRKIFRVSYGKLQTESPLDDDRMAGPLNSLKPSLGVRGQAKLELGLRGRERLQQARKFHPTQQPLDEPHEQEIADTSGLREAVQLDAGDELPLVPRPPMVQKLVKPEKSALEVGLRMLGWAAQVQGVPTSPRGHTPSQEQLNKTNGIELGGVFSDRAPAEPKTRPVWSSDEIHHDPPTARAVLEPPLFARRSPPPPIGDPLGSNANGASSSSPHVHGISSEGHARDLEAIRRKSAPPHAEDSVLTDADLPEEVKEFLSFPMDVPDLPWPKASSVVRPPELNCKLTGLMELTRELSWKPWKHVVGESVEDVVDVVDPPQLSKRATDLEREWSATLQLSNGQDDDFLVRSHQLTHADTRAAIAKADDRESEWASPVIGRSKSPKPRPIERAPPNPNRSRSPSTGRVSADGAPVSQAPSTPLPPEASSGPPPISAGRSLDSVEGPRSTVVDEWIEHRAGGEILAIKLAPPAAHTLSSGGSPKPFDDDVEIIELSASPDNELDFVPSEEPQPAPVVPTKRPLPEEPSATAADVDALLKKRKLAGPTKGPQPPATGDGIFPLDFMDPQPATSVEPPPTKAPIPSHPSAPRPVAPRPFEVPLQSPPYEDLPFSRPEFELVPAAKAPSKVHRIITSEALGRSRETYVALRDCATLSLVDRRNWSGHDPELIVDGTTCVIIRSLPPLVGRVIQKQPKDESLEGLVNQIVLAFDRVLIVLEREVGPGARASWTPPILRALEQLHEVVQGNAADTDIQICFAEGPNGTAEKIERFVGWCAARAEEQLDAVGSEGRVDGWDEREWLGDESQAELDLLDLSECVNPFAAALIASNCSAQEFESLSLEGKIAQFGAVCGEDRLRYIHRQTDDLRASQAQADAKRYNDDCANDHGYHEPSYSSEWDGDDDPRERYDGREFGRSEWRYAEVEFAQPEFGLNHAESEGGLNSEGWDR